MDYDIKKVKEHYEVYYQGKFICSADTESEAEIEAKEHFAERK